MSKQPNTHAALGRTNVQKFAGVVTLISRAGTS